MFWNLEKYGDHTAVIRPDHSTVTYRELAAASDAFAARLKGTRRLVFALVNNNLESLTAYLGCLRNGHVPLLLASNIAPDLLKLLIETYRPDYLWRPNPTGQYVLEPRLEVHTTEMSAELGILLSTSGSTGSPKLVRLSLENLNSNAESIVEYLHLTPQERAVTLLPMNYTYGLSVINSHLAAGAVLLQTTDTIMQREFWTFFKEEKGTSLVGVPYTYEMYKRLMLPRMNLPHLRYMTQAGGKLPAEEVRFWADWCSSRNVLFYVMYGQTEATARMSYLPPDMTLKKTASVGIAIPGGRFAIADENGREITEPDVVGELIYYGKNVSLGYAECESDLALGNINAGRLSTGDMAKWDSDHFVYITGRLKRFIKIAGNRFGLDEVERVLGANGHDCICGGKDDLLCIALLKRESDEKEVQKFITDRFHIHYSMCRIKHVTEVPRSDSGKLLYSKLFEEYL